MYFVYIEQELISRNKLGEITKIVPNHKVYFRERDYSKRKFHSKGEAKRVLTQLGVDFEIIQALKFEEVEEKNVN